MISVATDDLLHGGDEQLNQIYKLGKFTQGDGRFVGKEIKCRDGGSILVHQPLFAKKIQPIALEKAEAGEICLLH